MISQSLTPCVDVMLLLPSGVTRKLSSIEQSRMRTNKNYPQITPIPVSKVDKIRLTNEQIKQFESLALQLSSDSITMEQAILQLRGGSVSSKSSTTPRSFWLV
jgi:hypothetical protein